MAPSGSAGTMSTESVEALFDRAAERLSGVERGRMLASTGLKDTAAGKFFAFVTKGELVVKLPAERVEQLIASGEGGIFDAGKGRPMREWVRLSPADEATCVGYMNEARGFVARDRSIPAAVAKDA